MRVLEHFAPFYPQPGEVVDVEESPVVDLLGGDPPEREPVRLIVQQPFEPIERMGIVDPSVELRDRLRERSAEVLRVAGT
jgi:hypothetical protein